MVVREARNEEGRVLPRLPETRKNRGLHRRRLRWRNGPDNPVGDTRGGVWRSFKTTRSVEVVPRRREVWRCLRRREVWRCFKTRRVKVFKTMRRVKVFKTMRRVKMSQDGEKSADGWTRTRATQTPQRAERRQYETKVSMD